MNRLKIVFLFCFFIVASCALYEPQYRNPEITPVFPTHKEIEKKFLLIGDAGKSPDGTLSEWLLVVQNYLKTHPTNNDYAIFLGDNIYPDGMPPEGHEERKHSEYQLDAQLASLDNFNGTYYFIPGNHDWYNDGLNGLKREENYLIKVSNGRKSLQPENGCPIASVSVSENVQLIMIDSQWYITDWNLHPTVNEFCDIKTREKFFIELQTELDKHRSKTIVFAMHHPMFTNGTHGGYFALEKHLYPTQSKFPLPILSSLVTQIRAQGGVSIQDRYNELYNNLMVKLGALAKKNDRIVFASGHEHTLQHHEKDGLTQIVSGSGAKQSAASLGTDALFVTGAQGFAVMTVFKDGSSWVQYYIAGKNNEPKMVFQKELFKPYKVYETLDEYTAHPQQIEVPVYKEDSLKQSLFFTTTWGKKYQQVYGEDVLANVAMLDTLYGGLQVLSESGRGDYKALRLKDANGKIYRMRALKKNALSFERPVIFNDKSIKTLEDVQIEGDVVTKSFNADFYTATHPYAQMAIPYLAKKLDIFYTTPELYYVPKQNTLGLFNETFGDELYYIAIEPSVESDGESIFSYPVDIETTDDILIKIRQKKSIKIDEQNYITSRLFDMMIGDWDREADHWRWAEYSRKGNNLYVPIPRERDDAFSSLDGNILDVARSIFRGTRETHTYKDNLNDLTWFNEEGMLLDRAILQRSGRNQWTYAANYIKNNITDDVIEKAFDVLPDEVEDESLDEIKSILKTRRDKLVSIADRYYSLLSNLQTTTGTDSDDYFEVTRLPGGLTNVKTYRLENGVKSDVLADRTYNHNNTREVWIYGLDGNDTFVVNGNDNDLIYVRVIGGRGVDTFTINDGRRVKFYDTEDQITLIPTKNDGELIFTNIYELNTYDYRKTIDYKYLYAPTFGYNPDDGFKTGLQINYTVNSFKRNPFSKRHVVTFNYYDDVESFDVSYNGEFANSIGDSNLSIGLKLQSPNYTVNYFGFGNDTQNNEDALGYNFNRIELQNHTAKIGLIRNSSFGSVFSLFLKADSYKLQQSLNSLFTDKGETQLEDPDYFATLEGAYDYSSFDNPLNPTRGMVFNLTLGLTDNIQKFERIFGYLKTHVTFYNDIANSEKFVLKTNVAGQFNFGNLFEFYQGATIGANQGLRGYREERFTGKSALTGSADLRCSLNKFTLGLYPIQIGVYGGVDIGRVWTPDGNSNTWHNSRGGGLWLDGSGGLGATFALFNSNEGTRLTFGLGFNF